VPIAVIFRTFIGKPPSADQTKVLVEKLATILGKESNAERAENAE
jgi:hypothetical protein